MGKIFDFSGIENSENTIKKLGVSFESAWQKVCFLMMRLIRLNIKRF